MNTNSVDLAVPSEVSPCVSDARDAARYRYLRNLPECLPTTGLDVAWWEAYSGESMRGEKLDAAIDKALNTQQPTSEAAAK